MQYPAMLNSKTVRIGIDLDNTLIDYSNGARYLADDEQIANVSSVSDLRDHFKHSENEKWQYLQARLYTDGLKYAMPAKGSLEFLSLARERRSELFIISHKTSTTPERYGAHDLRKPALHWLTRHEIVPQLMPVNQVLFCASQDEKVQKIRDLKLDWFVDDLREVLDHSHFPRQTVGWLYAPGSCDETQTLRKYSVINSSHRVFSSFVDLSGSLKAVLDDS